MSTSIICAPGRRTTVLQVSPCLSACSNGHVATWKTLAVRHIDSDGEYLISDCLAGFSWLFRPFARLFLARAKAFMTSKEVQGLILGSRVALHLWEGVSAKSWSFLSPPWLLRDKGKYIGFSRTVTFTSGVY